MTKHQLPPEEPSQGACDAARPQERYILALRDEQSSDKSTIGDLLATLWSSPRLIIATTFSFATVAVVVALLATERYRAEVILSPPDTGPSASILICLGELGGPGSVIGGNNIWRPKERQVESVRDGGRGLKR